MSRRSRQAADDDVPRLPRGRGISVTRVQLIKIVGTAVLLVVVIVMQKPCANATSKFISNFDPPDAAPLDKPIPRPDQLEVPGSSGVYVDLEGLTPEQAMEVMEKARQEAAARLGSGSGSAGSGRAGSGATGSGSGSATGTGSGSATSR